MKKREIIESFDEECGPSLDEIAQEHGYADYRDYSDEYYEGHTGCELGEPAVWEPDLNDIDVDSDPDYKSDEYCEGFSDGYSEGYDDGYSDGWDDCTDYFESDGDEW